MDGLIIEEYFCQVIHVVVKFWLDEIVGEHRIEHLALNLYVEQIKLQRRSGSIGMVRSTRYTDVARFTASLSMMLPSVT